MRVLIISGGNIEDRFTIEWMKTHTYDYLMAADSGMDFLHRNGIIPDVLAGDFDSAGEAAYAFFGSRDNEDTKSDSKPEILRLNPHKDDTDTEFVVREAIRRGATDITVLGGTGTRLDHTLANIHLLGIGLEEHVQMRLTDSHNQIRMIEQELVISRQQQFGEYVSILPFGGTASGVTLEGFKYPLKDAILPINSSLGISNEIIATEANIQVSEGRILVIESRD